MTGRRHPSALPFAAGFAGAIALTAATPFPAQPQQRLFTTEIALDVNLVGIAAVTDDGARVAATVRTRRTAPMSTTSVTATPRTSLPCPPV